MNRKYFAAFFLLTFFSLLIWLSHTKSGDQILRSNKHELVSTDQTQLQIPLTKPNPAIAETSVSTNAKAYIGKRREQIEEATQEGLNQWRSPIDFYGKVLDEKNQPVTDARIHFEWNDLSETGTSEAQTISDNQGLFSLKGKTGKGMSLTITKEGYYTPQESKYASYEYGNPYDHFIPDTSNPVVFHLRKKGKESKLLQIEFPGFAHIAQLHHDGTPIELDLLKGAQTSTGNGQLKLEFWRNLPNKNARVYDWKLQLNVPGGGLIETLEEFAFAAPERGYQPSIVIDVPATNQNRQSEIRTKYYIQLPNGLYGRIDFYLLAYNGVFTVHSVINPSGSRNLEVP